MAGLTASAGFAGWVEFLLLRWGMNRKIGRSEFPTSFFMRLWLAAVLAAGVAWGIKLALHPAAAAGGGFADSGAVWSCLSRMHDAVWRGAGRSAGKALACEIPSVAREPCYRKNCDENRIGLGSNQGRRLRLHGNPEI